MRENGVRTLAVSCWLCHRGAVLPACAAGLDGAKAALTWKRCAGYSIHVPSAVPGCACGLPHSSLLLVLAPPVGQPRAGLFFEQPYDR
jgi:hypothetical protein